MSKDSQHKPYVAAETILPELTPVSIGLAILLSIILAGANAYLGLKVGMTVSASIPAAVIAMAALRPFRGNILQNNTVQTAASAGESLAAGAIFTLPALLLLGTWAEFRFWETTILVGLGGLLGVLFTIPLRRAMIVDQPLQFPEGVATAEVLIVGDQGGSGFGYVAGGSAIGALFKLGTSGFMLWSGVAEKAFTVGRSIGYIGTNLSPALVAVGYIVGLNIAILIFLGGATNWLIAIPVYVAKNGLVPTDIPDGWSAVDTAYGVWSTKTRYLGVGAMLVGGVWALIRLAPSLIQGIRSSLSAYRAAADGNLEVPRTERDTPIKLVMVIAVVALIPLFLVSRHFTGSLGVALFMAVFMLVAGFLFSAVAAYMAGLVGSSNNPISGVTIATILTASLLLKAFGVSSAIGPAAAIFIGSVVCCAAAIGGDNMQDLKAGHILGSTPVKLQIMQVIGVIAAVAIMAPLLNLLHSAWTIGSKELAAPQGVLMNAVASGVFDGGLPWTMVAVGAGLAVFIVALDLVLESKKSNFRMPVLAYAVGIYLPFELSVPIVIGGLVAFAAKRTLHGKTEVESETGMRQGLIMAAGLITGEALVGILLAVPIAISQDPAVLKFHDFASHGWPGLIILAGVVYLLYRVATRPDDGPSSKGGPRDPSSGELPEARAQFQDT